MVSDEHGGGGSTGTLDPHSSSLSLAAPHGPSRSLSTTPLTVMAAPLRREGDRALPRMRGDAAAAGRAGATPLPPGAKMAAPFVWSVSR